VEFNQTPKTDSPKLPNGEHSQFTLTLGCKECGQAAMVTPATGKQCQWWINIFRMKHDTCHMAAEVTNASA
jgi:hypothetical protein